MDPNPDNSRAFKCRGNVAQRHEYPNMHTYTGRVTHGCPKDKARIM